MDVPRAQPVPWAEEEDPRTVRVPVEPGKRVLGDLVLPRPASGLVLFAHGSGSGRLSPSNRNVAAVLHRARMATLLLDLLTEEEAAEDEETRVHRFNIRLLTGRLLYSLAWARREGSLRALPIGLYGASTGGAAVLRAGAAEPSWVGAIVLRGARTDLTPVEALERVQAPTLLLVGERDSPILEVNRQALGHLPSSSVLSIVPRATHLFEEPGALSEVGRRSRDWFLRHLQTFPQRTEPERGPTAAARSRTVGPGVNLV